MNKQTVIPVPVDIDPFAVGIALQVFALIERKGIGILFQGVIRIAVDFLVALFDPLFKELRVDDAVFTNVYALKTVFQKDFKGFTR